MKLLIILSILAFGLSVSAYDEYGNTSQAYLNKAIKAVYTSSPNAGFHGDCVSCHSNVPALPSSGFGRDFKNRTTAVFGGSQRMSQAQLQTLISDATLKALDSDGDGFTNLAEFQAGSDPGNSNSIPSANPTPTPTPTPTPPIVGQPPVAGGGGGSSSGPSKSSVGNTNSNYLSSGGCGISSRQTLNNSSSSDNANLFSFLGLALLPFGFYFRLRK